MDFVTYLFEHWSQILTALMALWLAVENLGWIIVKMTPSPDDDTYWGGLVNAVRSWFHMPEGK